jgi:hypothetical protein
MPVHRRNPDNLGIFSAMDRTLFHICVGTLYAKDIFRVKFKMKP